MGSTKDYLSLDLPAYLEQELHQNSSFGDTLSLNVNYIIVKDDTHDFTPNRAVFNFKTDTSVGEAANLAIRNFPGDLEALTFENIAVFFQASRRKPKQLVGSLDENLLAFYQEGGEMWISNDADCFKKARQKRQQKVLAIFSGALIGLFFLFLFSVHK